eukprot:3695068-Karenia_brevis.AAC.1
MALQCSPCAAAEVVSTSAPPALCSTARCPLRRHQLLHLLLAMGIAPRVAAAILPGVAMGC